MNANLEYSLSSIRGMLKEQHILSSIPLGPEKSTCTVPISILPANMQAFELKSKAQGQNIHCNLSNVPFRGNLTPSIYFNLNHSHPCQSCVPLFLPNNCYNKSKQMKRAPNKTKHRLLICILSEHHVSLEKSC